MKPNKLNPLRVIAYSPIVLFAGLSFWWSMNITGVDPKTGKPMYRTTYHGHLNWTRRRKGLWYKWFGKDELMYPTKNHRYYPNLDINQLHPNVIISPELTEKQANL